MKMFLRTLIAVMCALLLCGDLAFGKTDVLRVAFSEAPPAKVLGKDGDPTGFDIKLLEEMAKRLGVKLEYNHVPFKRGLHLLRKGEVDLMTGVLLRPERQEYLHFLQPAYKNYSDKAFFVRKGGSDQISSHNDLRDMTVCVALGVRYYPLFDTDRAIDKYEVSEKDLCFKMLLADHVDTVIITEEFGDYRVARLGISHQVEKAEYAYREQQDVYMVLSKKSPHKDRLAEFNRVMSDLVSEGELSKIKKDYYAFPPAY